LLAGIVLVAAFALWTVAIRLIDVQNAGPLGSEVGMFLDAILRTGSSQRTSSRVPAQV